MAAPLGNKNAIKAKPWGDAINRALLANKGKKLRALADRLIDRALEGDVAALKEVGDRVDGKVPQQLDHGNAPNGPFLLQVTATDANL